MYKESECKTSIYKIKTTENSTQLITSELKNYQVQPYWASITIKRVEIDGYLRRIRSGLRTVKMPNYKYTYCKIFLKTMTKFYF